MPPIKGWISEDEANALCKCIVNIASCLEEFTEIKILEIGTFKGHTADMFAWQASQCEKDLRYLGIEPFVAGAKLEIRNGFKCFIVPKPSVEAFHEINYFSPYDLILSDGCHCLDCVAFEWEKYSPLVNSGGYYALHDISWASNVFRDAASSHQVAQHGCRTVWERVKKDKNWEVVHESNRHWGGLGIVRRL